MNNIVKRISHKIQLLKVEISRLKMNIKKLQTELEKEKEEKEEKEQKINKLCSNSSGRWGRRTEFDHDMVFSERVVIDQDKQKDATSSDNEDIIENNDEPTR
jgi:Txe/YoeB family toxin of Txe-Axe toxin-antitoxin module